MWVDEEDDDIWDGKEDHDLWVGDEEDAAKRNCSGNAPQTAGSSCWGAGLGGTNPPEPRRRLFSDSTNLATEGKLRKSSIARRDSSRSTGTPVIVVTEWSPWKVKCFYPFRSLALTRQDVSSSSH